MADRPEQIYLKLCSDHLSIEAIPRRKIRVDFRRMRERPSKDFEVIMWTPHFVVVRNPKGQEITVRGDGRMLIRNAKSEGIAREAAAEMMNTLLRDFGTNLTS
jgi:hypothetical protein